MQYYPFADIYANNIICFDPGHQKTPSEETHIVSTVEEISFPTCDKTSPKQVKKIVQRRGTDKFQLYTKSYCMSNKVNNLPKSSWVAQYTAGTNVTSLDIQNVNVNYKEFRHSRTFLNYIN